MKSHTKVSLAALAMVIGLGGAGFYAAPSLAQAVGGPPGVTADKPVMHHRARHVRGGSFGHIDGRLAFLKAELKITPAQEPQWAAFEKVMRDNAAEMKASIDKMRADRKAALEAHKKAMDEAKAAGKPVPELKRPSAIERMERMQEFAKVRMDRQAKVLAALKPLYVSLSDDQKKTADGLFARFDGRHGHRGVRH